MGSVFSYRFKGPAGRREGPGETFLGNKTVFKVTGYKKNIIYKGLISPSSIGNKVKVYSKVHVKQGGVDFYAGREANGSPRYKEYKFKKIWVYDTKLKLWYKTFDFDPSDEEDY